METDKSQMLHQTGNEENTEEDYKPNSVPALQRLADLFFSAVLLAYGSYGLWINDMYIPTKRRGIHLHDLSAWVMFGAIVSACLVVISTCIDHYDKRNNEIKYQRFASTVKLVAWLFFVLSLSMEITRFDGSLIGVLFLVLVFLAVLIFSVWIVRLKGTS